MATPPRRRRQQPPSDGRSPSSYGSPLRYDYGGSPEHHSGPPPFLPPLHHHDPQLQPQLQDPGLMAHLMRQRHWQRHQEEHEHHPAGGVGGDGYPREPPLPLPHQQQPPPSRLSPGKNRPLLLRLRDQGPRDAGSDALSPMRALVEDQFSLARFWTDWRAAEHRFLASASSSSSSSAAGAAAGGASRPPRRRAHHDGDTVGAEAEAEEATDADADDDLEGDLEALLRECPGPRRPPSPLSASAGAAGAKLLDRQEDDAKQAAERPHDGHAHGHGHDHGGSPAVGAGVKKPPAPQPQPSEAEEDLAARVRELEARLVETEALLGSDPGTVILALEHELAQAKLALAHTEAEKDELEVQLCNLQHQQQQQQQQARA